MNFSLFEINSNLLNFLAIVQACLLDVSLQSQTKVVNSWGYIWSSYIIVALESTFPDQINIYVITRSTFDCLEHASTQQSS